MPKISILHIGKTGGTALKEILRPCLPAAENSGFLITLHQHGTRIRGVLREGDAKAVFFVRDPVTRFVSAFNSRLRQGRPRYDLPWSDGEAVAFKFFPTPNELAIALSSPDEARRAAAETAMHSILHVNRPLTNWLKSRQFLKLNLSTLFFVGFLETFDEDAKALMEKVGLTADIPHLSPVEKHQTPEGFDTYLSPEAEKNLREWYADDYLIYEWCLKNKKKINGKIEGDQKDRK